MWTGCRQPVHFSWAKDPGKSTLSGFWWTSGQLDSVYHEGHTKRNPTGQETCLRPQKQDGKIRIRKSPLFLHGWRKRVFLFQNPWTEEGNFSLFPSAANPCISFPSSFAGGMLTPPCKKEKMAPLFLPCALVFLMVRLILWRVKN